MDQNRVCTRQLEDVPELIHRIQSLLPVEEAERTCILSKSWLHAWSTIPTLRFPPQPEKFETEEQERKHKKLIDDTLQRYHRDNIPIESLDLQCDIHHQESPFVVENWIQLVASISCVKKLFLKICVWNDSMTLPIELFSSENLNTISLTAWGIYSLRICSNHVIKCVSLRVLHLDYVIISDEVLDKLLSVCSLLEKIGLLQCQGLKNCKVKNLPHLRELTVYSIRENGLWEISNVQRLRSFKYSGPIPFIMDSLGSLTQLNIAGVMIDREFFNTIESKFPLLENLRLNIRFWELEGLVIRSVSLKWLTLSLWESSRQVNVQVHAPKLLSFIYRNRSEIIHGLSFPTIAPKQIKLTYDLGRPLDNSFFRPLDNSFFLKLREVLNSSSKFNIELKGWNSGLLNIDVDDLRKRVSFPVRNVEEVSLESYSNAHIREKQIFDALFSICRPHYIKCSKLAVREMIEKKTNELKDIQVQDPHNGKWESLTSSRISILGTLDYPIKIKLIWFSE